MLDSVRYDGACRQHYLRSAVAMRRALAALLFCAGIFCLAQSNAQVPMTGAGVGAPGSGFTPSCSQSSTFLTAATGVTLTGDKTNYDTLICGLQTDGNLAGLDVLYIWAAPSAVNAALVNLANPGTFNGTVHATLTFSAYHGYTGDSNTGYMDTGFNPTTATSPNYVQNSATFGAYVLSSRTTNQNWWAVGNTAASNDELFAPYQTGTGTAQLNSATGFNVNNANAQGSYNITRTSSTQQFSYQNSNETATGNTSDTSVAPLNANIVFFAFQPGFGNTGDQLAAGWIGKGVTAVNSCKINNRINTYLQFVTGGGSDIRVYTNSAC